MPCRIFCLLLIGSVLASCVREQNNNFLCLEISVDPEISNRYDSILHVCKINRSIDLNLKAQLNLDTTKSTFKLRIVDVTSSFSNQSITEENVVEVIEIINHAFSETNFQFELFSFEQIAYDKTIENLRENDWKLYDEFVRAQQENGMVNLFVFDNQQYCEVGFMTKTCSRTGGFAYPIGYNTFSVFLNEFDFLHKKILPHELGHFFGLRHTFHNSHFVNGISEDNTEMVDHYLNQELGSKFGDQVYDTPADPNEEIYVDYSTCEMKWNYETSTKKEYKPLINNYMNYYKPCYL